MKTATHNSATGERGKGLLSFLVTPFARCQRKTLKEQYLSGCRLFDFRVRYIGDKLYVVHGLWTSKKTFREMIKEIDSVAEEEYLVIVMYDGEVKSVNGYMFDVLSTLQGRLATIYEVSVKKPMYKKYLEKVGKPRYTRCFKVIEGWRCLLPIPYVWHLITKREQVDGFNMVDFL